MCYVKREFETVGSPACRRNDDERNVVRESSFEQSSVSRFRDARENAVHLRPVCGGAPSSGIAPMYYGLSQVRA
jgi:hypothetical protein